MDNFNNKMETMAMRYAQATGHLQGVLISMALYEEITPRNFKFIYNALERSAELAGQSMSDFDRERFQQRADAMGITL